MFYSFLFDSYSHIVGILIVFVVLFNILVDKAKKVKSATTYSACTNPKCVRCNNYAQICEEAQSKLEHVKSKRLHTSVKLMKNKYVESSKLENREQVLVQQAPSVFHMQGLLASPLWNPEEFQADVNELTAHYEDILNEFHTVYKAETGWLKNETPTGSWCIYPLINQGVLIEENAAMCPKTIETVLQLKSLMNLNVFGNVTFSVVNPQTLIMDHYGPTNIRIRCHLGKVSLIY